MQMFSSNLLNLSSYFCWYVTSISMSFQVSIPLTKIKSVNKSQNVEKPSQKYIEIVTVDDFDFWFMGFFNYQKALRCLQQAVPQA